MLELQDFSVEKSLSPPPILAEEKTIDIPFIDVERLEKMPTSKKPYIDLIKPTPKEDLCKAIFEIGETSEKRKFGKKNKVIKHLKKHNKQLKKKKSRLQKRMTKLVEKHNKLYDFSQKLMKKNKKLYWTTKVLKTNGFKKSSNIKLLSKDEERLGML